MDLTFNEEQAVFQQSFREFMENECSQDLIEEVEAGEAGYSAETWLKMAGLGWLGLGLSEVNGAGDILTACILCEEMGRVLLPVPFTPTVVLGGRAVSEGGKEPARSEIIDSIERGDCIIANAIMASERFEGLQPPGCEARKGEAGYVLDGSKRFVQGANISNLMLVTAGTESGLTAFLLDPGSSGVTLEPLHAMGGEKFFNVHLKGTKVDEGLVLGEPGGADSLLSPIVDRAKVALAAGMVGGASAVLDKSVQYAKERIQFKKPIGSFQAIAFQLADCATELTGARLLTYKAAWMIDNRKEGAPRYAAMAKAHAADIYRKVTDVGVHTHGGYGFMLEYDIQHYYRRARADGLALGDPAYNRELVYSAHRGQVSP